MPTSKTITLCLLCKIALEQGGAYKLTPAQAATEKITCDQCRKRGKRRYGKPYTYEKREARKK